MINSMKPSKYYRWLLMSKNHMQGFTDWLVDNDCDVYEKSKLERGEVIAFNSVHGRGSLFETGYANKNAIYAIRKYLKSRKNNK